MNLEQAQTFLNTTIFAQEGKNLKKAEKVIIECAWCNRTYEEVAEQAGYSARYFSQDLGPKLWKRLSQALGENVSKKTLKLVLQKRWRKPAVAPVEASQLPDVEVPQTINLELLKGPIELNSSFYIERPPIESDCYQKITQPGALIRIKAPHQRGKTSLMTRILAHTAQQDYHNVYLNFQLASKKIFADLDLFLKWFCASVGAELELPNQIEQHWDEFMGSKLSCDIYFKKYLLSQIEKPLVIAIDNIDNAFLYDEITEEFFGLLRAWHEAGKSGQNSSNIWKKLRFILVYSTEAYLIADINQSPFNVGLAVDLPEFTTAQVQMLAQRYQLNWQMNEVEQLMAMVGGHPYLLQIALNQIARKHYSIADFLHLAPTAEGPYRNHLGMLLDYLKQQHEDLIYTFKEVLETNSLVCLDSVERFKLYSMGLVHLEGNEVKIRCDLYRQYFQSCEF